MLTEDSVKYNIKKSKHIHSYINFLTLHIIGAFFFGQNSKNADVLFRGEGENADGC